VASLRSSAAAPSPGCVRVTLSCELSSRRRAFAPDDVYAAGAPASENRATLRKMRTELPADQVTEIVGAMRWHVQWTKVRVAGVLHVEFEWVAL
jgi:hypothetical protein